MLNHDYVVPSYFSLAEIISLLKSAEESFGKENCIVTLLQEQLAVMTIKGPLTSLDSLRRLHIFDLYFGAKFESDGYPLETFETLLESLAPDFGMTGDLSVSCRVQRSDEGYPPKYRDIIGAELRNGRLSFRYAAISCAFDKKIQKQNVRQAEKDALFRVIKTANLPAIIVTEGEDYFIEPTTPGAKWHLTENPLVMVIKNAASFKCELPDTTVKETIQRVKAVLVDFEAGGKKVRSEWDVTPYSRRSIRVQSDEENVSASSQEHAKRLLGVLVGKDFPAQKISLMFKYHLRELNEIEHLTAVSRFIVGGKEEGLLTSLCGCRLPDGEMAEISILTNCKGHQLSVSVDRRNSIQLVEEKLGLKLISEK